MAGFAKKFDSAKQEWTTPQNLFDRLDEEFQFKIDLAADSTNAKCNAFLDESIDALTRDWSCPSCWLNPPYGSKSHKLENWIKKAYEDSEKFGSTIVVLIPARTNTRWWHKYCMNASEVRFICGRPKFGDAKHGLPQPLALIIFRGNDRDTKFTTFYN